MPPPHAAFDDDDHYYCLARHRPRWRGKLHLWCGLAAPLWWWHALRLCRADLNAIAATVLSLLSTSLMLLSSGMYHTGNWLTVEREEWWGKLDYVGIFLQVAFCMAPWYALLMPPALGWGILALLALTVAAGAWLAVSESDLTRVFGRHGLTCVFIVQGAVQFIPLCTQLGGAPSVFEQLLPSEVCVLFFGLTCYVIGSQIFASRTWDLWPDDFGFHEVWHLLVVVAASCTYWADCSVIARVVGQG